LRIGGISKVQVRSTSFQTICEVLVKERKCFEGHWKEAKIVLLMISLLYQCALENIFFNVWP